jgi:nucleoside-diphosphate-sugar epimerase
VTRVAVFGSSGKMGAEVCRAVTAADGLELVAAVDVGDDRTPAESADVAVDFTSPDAVMDNLRWCIDHGVHAVVGTTGFTPVRLDQLRTDLQAKPAPLREQRPPPPQRSRRPAMRHSCHRRPTPPPMRFPARAALRSTASGCTVFGCVAWSLTKRSSSARRGRR